MPSRAASPPPDPRSSRTGTRWRPPPRRSWRTLARARHRQEGTRLELLDLARIDAGHINLDARPLCLTALLREALDDQQPSADTIGLTLIGGLGAPLTIRGDTSRLRQVIDNLLSNAINYTPPGGTVAVTAEPADGGVRVRISDTGIGIPAEQLPHLFTRFFRASTALEHGIKGTGLGLAVTKAIIEAHHGSITAQPAPGGGTRFTVWLPHTGAATGA
ncbi:sensor histidine kinase [Cryptosporangium sp. NPDC048952]|uniref:sensor histidine kinase n=1 Tax=Cryptosporangium sp. NPDC048952 TaxID=3363961 RepID=UPI00372294F0